ncbi:MAG: hypothetical protein KGN84_22755 [Acidobacteriota bacterium]|nr:hypothetical protein [Acidobacteriota bacterium]
MADTSVTTTGFLPAIVTADVRSSDGAVAIPANSPAVVVVRESGKKGAISRMSIGLYSVRIADTEHDFSNGEKEPAFVSFTEDAGNGPAHSAVHLQFGTLLEFKLETPVELR